MYSTPRRRVLSAALPLSVAVGAEVLVTAIRHLRRPADSENKDLIAKVLYLYNVQLALGLGRLLCSRCY